MSLTEEMVILLAVSLDVFAAMECQGALVARVQKKQLVRFCLLLMAGQASSLGAGNYISRLLCNGRYGTHEMFLGEVAAAAIFLCLGIRLLLKSWKNERVVEHREEKMKGREIARLYVRNMLFTLLAGLALGILECNAIGLLVFVLVFTLLGTVLGAYTGYRLGGEHKGKVYLAGGILLVAGGVDVVVRYLMAGGMH